MFIKRRYKEHIAYKKKISIGQFILLMILMLVTIATAVPVLFVFISAFTDENALMEAGFRLFPSKLSLNGFNTVL